MGALLSLLDRLDNTLAEVKTQTAELDAARIRREQPPVSAAVVVSPLAVMPRNGPVLAMPVKAGAIEALPVSESITNASTDMRDMNPGPGDVQFVAILMALTRYGPSLPVSVVGKFDDLRSYAFTHGILRPGGDLSLQYGRFPVTVMSGFQERFRTLLKGLFAEFESLPGAAKVAVTDFIAATRFYSGGDLDLDSLRFTAWLNGAPMNVSTVRNEGYRVVSASDSTGPIISCDRSLKDCGLTLEQPTKAVAVEPVAIVPVANI